MLSGAGEGRIGDAENRPEPVGGLVAVAERDDDLVADEDPAEFGGHVKAERRGDLRRSMSS